MCFYFTAVSLQKVSRCALITCDKLMGLLRGVLLLLLHAETSLLHKSFLCGLLGGGVALPVSGITTPTELMFLGRFC